MLADVFALRPFFEWRGLGSIAHSALQLSPTYADFDAELRYDVPGVRVADPKACQCGEVLKGVLKPWECKVFGTACTPETPIGTCMVSSEGACAAYYNFGQYAKQRLHLEVLRVTDQTFTEDRGRRAHRGDAPAAAAVPRRAHHDGARRRRQGEPGAGRGADRAAAGRTPRWSSSSRRGAAAPSAASRLALTTDAFVVRPIRFPGGSIGELAVNGTVNDLAVSGARPVALSAALVLEEGLAADVLRAEVAAMAAAARAAGVPVVTGDTKVVERGQVRLDVHRHHRRRRASSDDVALAPRAGAARATRCCVSGTIGDHGVAIMLARGDLDIEADVRSDTAAAVGAGRGADGRLRRRPALHAGRHPRRRRDRAQRDRAGGRGRRRHRRGVRLPLRPEVVGAGEILGIDPLYVANEGKLVAFVAAEQADAALAAMRALPAGADAAIIGEVREEPPGPGARADLVRRPPADRHARRRPAAADLLTASAYVAFEPQAGGVPSTGQQGSGAADDRQRGGAAGSHTWPARRCPARRSQAEDGHLPNAHRSGAVQEHRHDSAERFFCLLSRPACAMSSAAVVICTTVLLPPVHATVRRAGAAFPSVTVSARTQGG